MQWCRPLQEASAPAGDGAAGRLEQLDVALRLGAQGLRRQPVVLRQLVRQLALLRGVSSRPNNCESEHGQHRLSVAQLAVVAMPEPSSSRPCRDRWPRQMACSTKIYRNSLAVLPAPIHAKASQ